tara:strand:- start:4659 stop:4778 length:120 start_codon:yes stop_codon:yes gene_type:complete
MRGDITTHQNSPLERGDITTLPTLGRKLIQKRGKGITSS